jgi:hypothetical protein
MDDGQLGRKIVLNDRGEFRSYTEIGAAARAARIGTVSEIRDIEIINALKPATNSGRDRIGNVLSDLRLAGFAVVRHFARAPIPTSHDIAEAANARAPGGAVPSQNDIQDAMVAEIVKHRHSGPDSFHCARVAHAMMQRIGGRAEMMIADMDMQAITVEMANEWGDTTEEEREVIRLCARVSHRLATTPRTVDDPDKKAKRLAWEFHKAALVQLDVSTPDELWATFKDHQRIGWRAVAKGKADE